MDTHGDPHLRRIPDRYTNPHSLLFKLMFLISITFEKVSREIDQCAVYEGHNESGQYSVTEHRLRGQAYHFFLLVNGKGNRIDRDRQQKWSRCIESGGLALYNALKFNI
ncbi:hypothetical protein ElyMa_001549600 [Elysia marginata]|uniref:Uncharacterized protein n=1 Tax=Elysia marginata TaxID=1093978 RepID=A0AAV4JDZ5_9GAST|nr:hypothetical protein ElyMa_001549600 [Elysia marginata]